MSERCPTCGKEFKSVGHHWSHNPHHRPDMTQYQMEVARGLLMGDGSMDGRQGTKNQNPALRVNMVTVEYLKHLDGIFGPLGRGVSLQAESEKVSEYLEDGLGVVSDNCRDIYRFYTCSHPDLLPLSTWYDSGKKVWPKNIRLTPTVMKHWYVGDGSLTEQGTVRIAMVNEKGNEEKVESYFRAVNLPTPNAWETNERSGDRGGECHYARWNVEESKALLDYMGSPLPGFEYKWPDEGL